MTFHKVMAEAQRLSKQGRTTIRVCRKDAQHRLDVVFQVADNAAEPTRTVMLHDYLATDWVIA